MKLQDFIKDFNISTLLNEMRIISLLNKLTANSLKAREKSILNIKN
jgi:hypothetical protein